MSRLINNQIWNARSFTKLSTEDKLLFLYLETSPETNYYGVFILPDNLIISARTGISTNKIEKSLQTLQKENKLCLVGDYLIIFDYFDRQKNNKSEKTKKGLATFEKSLPKEVKEIWIKGRSTPVEGGMKGVSNPLEENKVNKKEKKIKYKEFVFLTEIELKKLEEQFGESRTQDYISNLNNYIGSTGKKYKSHYHTILTWSKKDKTTATQEPQSKLTDLINA